MTKVTFFILLSFFLGTKMMKAQENIDSIISDIKNKFQLSQRDLNSCKINTYNYFKENSDPKEINFTAYYLPSGRLTKLVAKFKFHHEESTAEIYLDNPNIYFVFASGSTKNGNLFQERIYYNNEQVIRYLIKEKDLGDQRNFTDIPNIEKVLNQSNLYYSKAILNTYLSYPTFKVSDDNNLKISNIKKEYKQIEVDRKASTLKLKRINYHNDQAFWRNTSYDAYYNKQDELVLLTYSLADEGYLTTDSIYFKNRKPFFIINTQATPADEDYITYNLTQDRIYMYNNQVIKVLRKAKNKYNSNDLDFTELLNNEITNQISNLEEYYNQWISHIGGELIQMYDAFENQ